MEIRCNLCGELGGIVGARCGVCPGTMAARGAAFDIDEETEDGPWRWLWVLEVCGGEGDPRRNEWIANSNAFSTKREALDEAKHWQRSAVAERVRVVRYIPDQAAEMIEVFERVTREGDLLLLEDVAELARVSVSTVRHWIKVGKLTSLRPGRRRMVRKSELEKFLGVRVLRSSAAAELGGEEG